MSKAVITAVTNQKGGTGKTTTCESLGVGLARAGKKVLLVDCDPQASLSLSLEIMKPDELQVSLSTIMQRSMNDLPFDYDLGLISCEEGIDLMPNSIELSGVETTMMKLKEDLREDQMSLVEYIDPFTGEPVKKYNKLALRAQVEIVLARSNYFYKFSFRS